ncbi:hypothetical protein JCM11251_002896 [Rhodosporidiobolus azoricus]
MTEALWRTDVTAGVGGLGIASHGTGEEESAQLVLLPALLAGEEKVVGETSTFAFPPPTAAMNSLRRARSAFALSPGSSPDLSASSSSKSPSPATNDSFFSWTRWYGSSASTTPLPALETSPSGTFPPPSTDDVSRLVRAALRRSRTQGGETASASSSASSSDESNVLLPPAINLETEEGDRLTLSPASSSGDTEWPWDALPAGHDTPYLDGETVSPSLSPSKHSQSPRLRTAQSAATLRARPTPATAKLLKRVSSQIGLSTEAAEVAPHSPSSPSFGTLPSPTVPFALSASTSSSFFAFPPSSPPTLPAEASASPSLSFSSRLRRAASSATLRSINPFRISACSSSPRSPELSLSSPSLAPAIDSSFPSPSSTSAPAASILLRDLLLRHDSLADPPPLPPIDTSSPPSGSPYHSDEEDGEEDEREDAEVAAALLSHSSLAASAPLPAAPFYTRPSHSHTSRIGTSSIGEASTDTDSVSFSLSTDSELSDADDPFSSFSATAAHHASLAWMSAAPSSVSSTRALAGITLEGTGRGAGAGTSSGGGEEPAEGGNDDPFADADSLPPDSPSLFYPPFDPFALRTALPTGPMRPTPSLTSKPRPPRVLTKQRSFVDPRTRKLRTAPGVVVTPSTPERERVFRRGE